MSKKNKLELAIAIFRQAGGVLRMSEALTLGVNRSQLYELRDSGLIEAIGRGLYQLVEVQLAMPDFAVVAKKVPRGVICLLSALAFHELTTQIPHFVYLAIPRSARCPKISYPPIRCFWYPDQLLNLGVEIHNIDGVEIKIFNPEKSLIDCLRLRNRFGMNIVIESLKMYCLRKDTNMNLLLDYSRMVHLDKILKPILEVILNE